MGPTDARLSCEAQLRQERGREHRLHLHQVAQLQGRAERVSWRTIGTNKSSTQDHLRQGFRL